MLVGVVTELPIEGIEERAQICHELGSFLHGLPRRGNQTKLALIEGGQLVSWTF